MGLLSTVIKSVAGPLIGGISSAFGAKEQNKAAAAASQKQMDFQERMSNTQYQRSMEDMRKAGLNPILAYKQGGAGTPGGSTYSPINVGQAAVAGAGAGATSALALRHYKLEEDQNRATIAKTYSEQYRNDMETGLLLEQTKNADTQRKQMQQQIEVNKTDVTSAKAANKLYKGPFGDFFKWWQMLFKKR